MSETANPTPYDITPMSVETLDKIPTAPPEGIEQPEIVSESRSSDLSDSAAAAVKDLKEQVARTRRRRQDAVDAGLEQVAITKPFLGIYTTTAGTTIASGIYEAFGNTVLPFSVIAVGAAATMGGVLVARGRLPRHAKHNSVQIADGYGLQALYAKAAHGHVGAKDVAVAILPRTYDSATQEQPSQAARRLREALHVAALSEADKVLIPGTLLRRAGSGLHGTEDYETLLSDITNREPIVPDGTQRCLALDTKSAVRLAEQLTEKQAPLDTLLSILQERFPWKTALREHADDAEKLLPTLHDLVSRTFQGELPGSTRGLARETDSRQVGIPKGRIKDGPKANRIGLAAELITNDPYNPTFRQFLMTNRDDKAASHVLSEYVSKGQSDGPSMDGELYERTNLELLYLTLQAAKRANETEQVDTEPVVEHPGKRPKTIGRRETQRQRRERAAKFVAKAALATGLIATSLTGIAAGVLEISDTIEAQVSTNTEGSMAVGGVQGGGSETDTLWRIAEHGMEGTGYFAEELNNTYRIDTKTWTTRGASEKEIVGLPQQTPANRPHLTLSAWVPGGSTLRLPVKMGTHIGAVRLRDAEGDDMPYKLKRAESGIYAFGYMNPEPALLEYDLVSGQSVHAVGLVALSGNLDHDDLPAGIKSAGRLGGAKAVARYTAQYYTYEQWKGLDQLVSQPTANDFINAIDHAHTCNCNVCATVVGLSNMVYGNGDFAVVAGQYQPTANAKYLFGNKHAWNTNGTGDIVDGTPGGGPQSQPNISQAELDAQWEAQARHPDPIKQMLPWLFAGNVILLAVLGERQLKLSDRLMNLVEDTAATRRLWPHQVYGILSQYAYARPDSLLTVPQKQDMEAYTPPEWSNVPLGTIEKAAAGKLHVPGLTAWQRADLRNTAKIVLRRES